MEYQNITTVNSIHNVTLLRNGYAILGVLGRGTFGVVYKVMWTYTRAIFAAKVVNKRAMEHMSQRWNTDADEVAICMRLLDAARQGAAIGVNSENVVQVHNVFYDQENYYIVMEYLNGQTLFDLIKNNYRNGLCDAGPKAVQMCAWSILSGIRYLKRLNIVHRDIKPTNVFISERGPGDTVVKLIDLGLGIILDDYSTSLMSSYVCTPLYAYPDLEDRLPYNSKCDLWCAGMTIYFMATGRELVSEKSRKYKEEKKIIRIRCQFGNYTFKRIKDKGLERVLNKLLCPNGLSVEEIMADPWFDGCTVPRNSPTTPKFVCTQTPTVVYVTPSWYQSTQGFTSVPTATGGTNNQVQIVQNSVTNTTTTTTTTTLMPSITVPTSVVHVVPNYAPNVI